jgi:hypothetical protein
MNTHHVSLAKAYAVTKRLIELEAHALRRRNPLLSLPDACTKVLRQHPEWWKVYRAAMRAGLPSEFQSGKRKPPRPTPAQGAWMLIDDLSRTLVAASTEVVTLYTAIQRVVTARPELYQRYIAASRRERRARESDPSRRTNRRPSGGRSRSSP